MKHILKKSCLVVGCILLLACGRSSEFFIGKWQILSVVEDDQVMDLHENWIHLKEDGTFSSYDGEAKKSETGKWLFDNSSNELFIDGEGDSEDSYWLLSLKNYTLIFRSVNGSMYLNAVSFTKP